MADRIKLRRGPKSKIDLNVYELGYATDSTEKRLYFNDGSMVPIPNEKDINDIKAELTEATNVSNQNKQDIDELKENVSGIIRTGVAKLVMYSYDVKLSEDTQKVNIPYERFDSATDTLKVYVNGIAIPNEYYTITNPVENDGIITNGYIVLTESRPIDTIVRFEVWKNVPSGEEGGVSGSVIAENSLPLDRIIGIDDITTQLNALTNNKADKKNSEFIGTMKLNNKDVSTSEIIDLSVLSFENGWKIYEDTSYNSKIVKEGNMVHLNVLVANDSPALSTTVFILPESLRPLKCAITLSNQGTRIIEARIYTDGRLIFQSGEITPSSWININMTYSLK